MRAVLIVNPQASATTPGDRDQLVRMLADQVKLDVIDTGCRGHATAAARAAVADNVDLLVAYGGDGTVNEVVNGLLTGGPSDRQRHVPELGVVPGGSTNVFARALGLPRDPIRAASRLLHAVATASGREVGLGRAGDRWFTFNAGMGWDADVVAEVDRRRGKRTSPSLYVRMAVASYFRLQRSHPVLTVHIPGRQPIPVGTAFVSNTDPWSYLGPRPVHLNPGCSFDNDLGLFALTELDLATVFRHVQQALRKNGHHRGHHLLRHDNLPSLRISAEQPVNLQVDGDLVGPRTQVEFTSVPRALTVAM